MKEENLKLLEQELKECGENHPEFKELKSFNLTYEEQEGGEGEGDYYHVILKAIKHNAPEESVFILFQGHYTSYSGVEWCYDPCFVEKKPVEVMEWVGIKRNK